MNGTPWTTEQDAELTRRWANESCASIAKIVGKSMSATYQRAYKFGLKKDPDFLRQVGMEGAQQESSIATRFKKGQKSWNKGLKGVTFGGVETQFKKGHRGGKALEKYQPIGTERTSRDGYLERKVNDDMPLQRRWRAVHILLWESVNGVLPKNHCLIFKDGNKTNITLDNLELITRAENMRRNTIHRYPPELKSAIRQVSKLKRTIENERHQQPTQDPV